MSHTHTSLFDDLAARGLIAQCTHESLVREALESESITLYSGFDPTADSLHIGSLVPLLTLKRFQQAGHRPIVLVGGATGLIGDPSFKSEERKLNTPDTVKSWVNKLKAQTSAFLDFSANGQNNTAVAVNNLDWTENVSILDFLRNVGKHFSINNMIQKESVKQRIDRDGEGISFTEFSYMLLQSFDFVELNKRYNCTLQIGGSDQWGNITGGIDLTRRVNNQQVFGLTLPLVTKSDGTKFGKTESGTIWLDASKTSPYAFYQFWLNTADADVYKFLRYFTFLDVSQIDAIEAEDQARQGRPEAQKILAAQVTQIVHGEQGLTSALRITQSLFSGDSSGLNKDDLLQLRQDGLPFIKIDRNNLAGVTVTKMLADINIANGKQAKDALARKAVSFNGMTINANPSDMVTEVLKGIEPIANTYYLVKLGKKKHVLVEF